MLPVPVFSADLVQELDRLFPERCPSAQDSEREIWVYTGKRELVRNLLMRLEIARDNERKD